MVPVMDKFGGQWRLNIRLSRWAALNACMSLVYRVVDRTLPPLRNRGGWMRDEFNRILGERPSQPTERTTS